MPARLNNRAVLAVVVAAMCNGPAGAQMVSYGPLTAEEGSPIYRLGYTPTFEAADPVEPADLRLDVWSAYGNIFEQDSASTHELYLDVERLINTVGVRYGVAPGLEVGGRLTFETTWGGFLDPLIESFHTAFGFGTARRDRYPTGAHRQVVRDGTGELRIDIPSGTFSLEEARLFAKIRVLGTGPIDRHAASVKIEVRIPTRENRIGQERVDIAVLGLARRSLGRWHLHGMVGGATVRASPELRTLLRPVAIFYAVGVERSMGRRWSTVVQLNGATARLEPLGNLDLDGPAMNLLVGVAGSFRNEWRFDVSFQEDVPPGTPSVDFTLGIRVSRLWAGSGDSGR